MSLKLGPQNPSGDSLALLQAQISASWDPERFLINPALGKLFQAAQRTRCTPTLPPFLFTFVTSLELDPLG